mmetsp:Transcript_59677/g.176830  ORF Transcript_59677/g.176830 Transcript_59677/m.176830 type:complete len:82 (-) Transcript_59677:264-509(-)
MTTGDTHGSPSSPAATNLGTPQQGTVEGATKRSVYDILMEQQVESRPSSGFFAGYSNGGWWTKFQLLAIFPTVPGGMTDQV